MDVLSDYTSPIVEFKASLPLEKLSNLMVDNCTGTEPPPAMKTVSVETNSKEETATQTEFSSKELQQQSKYDERALANWLRKIYPAVELELQQGLTPNAENYMPQSELSLLESIKVQTYQKLNMAGHAENSQGLATWLSVHTNNAPVLVATTVAPHDDWCEHVNQSLKLYIPKRVPQGNFVVFTELKSVQLKSCLRSLCTNPFNKNIFAGASMDGDIYIWQYEHATIENMIDLKELHCSSSQHGAAIAMDWPTENRLLTCYANGLVQQWIIGKQMLLEWEYTLRPVGVTNIELTCLLSLSLSDFIVGTKAGCVYRCWHAGAVSVSNAAKQMQISTLCTHRFMVSTLLRTNMAGHATVVLSCDLSGQVHYHEKAFGDEETSQVTARIPLPFKNSIACTPDGSIIYCPSVDGALECYRISDGAHTVIKGALHGKGNLIKCSDNGCWIITGLYGDDFQIFYVDK